MTTKNGCEWGRTNRLSINAIEKTQTDIMSALKDIQKNNTEMFNHFTERYEEMFKEAMTKVPQWIVAITGIAGALLGGLAIWALTR
jgi:ferric iron reductase protein FhuF